MSAFWNWPSIQPTKSLFVGSQRLLVYIVFSFSFSSSWSLRVKSFEKAPTAVRMSFITHVTLV